MPLIEDAIEINATEEMATVPAREWGVPAVVGNDGHFPIQQVTPIGINAQPTNITGVTIDGISIFEGITTGEKTLSYTAATTTLVWDGGEGVDIGDGGTFKVYDSSGKNYILVTVDPLSLPAGDKSDTITLQNSVLADQITVIALKHKADCVATVKDASGALCSPAGTHPRPTNAANYTISEDKMEIAIKNNQGTEDLYIKLFSYPNMPKLHYNPASVSDDYGMDTKIYGAAQSLFAQGVRRFYILNVVPMGFGNGEYGDSGYGDATDWASGLDNLTPYAENGEIEGAMIAGITAESELADLKTWCDANNIIFTATNADSDTVSDITTAVSALASRNGFFIARKQSRDDIAAVALGVLMTLKPWVTPFWKSINASISDYFSPDEIATLETGKANVVVLIASSNRLSNRLTTGGDPKFIDVTRTKYYAISLIRDAIASLRLKMEKIPFDERGLGMIKSAITKAMEEMVLVGALREHRPELDMPA